MTILPVERNARVLRPGGRALLFVPAFMFVGCRTISAITGAVTRSRVERCGRQAGFEVERATYVNPVSLHRYFSVDS